MIASRCCAVLVACALICFLPGAFPCTAQEVELSELLQQLRSPSTSARVKAAAEIAELGPMAVSAAPALIEALRCERIEVLFASGEIARSRHRFADALVQLGDMAVPALDRALKHENGLVRVGAADALHRIEGEPSRNRVIPVLIAALSEGNEVASDAALVLEKMGADASPAISELIERLDHRDLITRSNFAHALAAIVKRDEASQLAKALRHDNLTVRVGAAFALQRVDAESSGDAQSAIAAALRSDSPDVRRQAVWAIGQMGASAQPLVEQLIDALPELTPDPRAYFFGRGALSRHSTDPSIALAATGRESLPALTDALDDDNLRVRVMVAVALLRLDPTQAARVAPIFKEAKENPDQNLRFIADMHSARPNTSKPQEMDDLIRALLDSGGFGRPSPAASQLVRHGAAAVGPLMDVLKSGDGLAAGQATRVLARIGQPALPALKEVMEGDNDQLRVFAVRALAGMGEPAAPALIKALKDELYPVRRTARYALKSIGTPESLNALRKTQDD